MKSSTILFLGLISIAFTTFGTESPSNSVVDIKMDNMIVHKREGYIELIDNVVLKIDDTIVKADKAIVFQSKDGGKGKKAFEKIVATGRVRINSPEGVVMGEKAVWSQDKNVVRLTGNPGVEYETGRILNAKAINYNLLTKTCSFEGRSSGKNRFKSSDKDKLF